MGRLGHLLFACDSVLEDPLEPFNLEMPQVPCRASLRPPQPHSRVARCPRRALVHAPPRDRQPVLGGDAGDGAARAPPQRERVAYAVALTFVPKVAAIFVAIALSLPLMYTALTALSDQSFDLIISNGR